MTGDGCRYKVAVAGSRRVIIDLVKPLAATASKVFSLICVLGLARDRAFVYTTHCQHLGWPVRSAGAAGRFLFSAWANVFWFGVFGGFSPFLRPPARSSP